MNSNSLKYLTLKLEELKKENIISGEQTENAKNYFSKNSKPGTSVATIFTAIGILLVALSMITIFAFNWDNLSKEIKIILAFMPLVITAIMLYITIKKDTEKWKIYTSIFAPIAITATNSLISQIFHIQTEIFEMVFLCIIMYLPIVAILRNTIGIIIYGIATIIYVASSCYMPDTLLNEIAISLPLIGYNIYNYIKNKGNQNNIVMWLMNLIILTILLFVSGISNENQAMLRPDVILIYGYMIYLMTRKLFGEKNPLIALYKFALIAGLLILSMAQELVSFAAIIEFKADTLILSIITVGLIFNLKTYKDIKEMILLANIFLLQYTKMPYETLFIFINILVIALGTYYIVLGNKIREYNTILSGVAIILLLISFRFINSDLDFIQKSIMFLITGSAFIITANVMKKKLGGN